MSDDTAASSNDAFLEAVSEPLNQALVGALGQQLGQEAHANAMVYAWEHGARVASLASPIGYLFKVGRSSVRDRRRRVDVQFALPPSSETPDVEPGLPGALAALPEKQRLAVVLVVGFGWSQAEVGRLTGKSEATIRGLVKRGMSQLRRELKVEDLS